MKLVFATGNPGKVHEASGILGEGFTVITSADAGIPEDIPETGTTLRENSLQKAMYIHERTGLDCFADDSGLEVDALGGAPGVETARYAGPGRNPDANMAKLLGELERAGALSPESRTARFRTSVCLILGGSVHFFEGVMEGRIATEKRGEGGFGYDPVFIPAGMEITNAQLPDGMKNKISHRGKALRAMAAFLNEH